jgi:hypothetical protein
MALAVEGANAKWARATRSFRVVKTRKWWCGSCRRERSITECIKCDNPKCNRMLCVACASDAKLFVCSLCRSVDYECDPAVLDTKNVYENAIVYTFRVSGVAVSGDMLLEASASLIPVRFNLNLGQHPYSTHGGDDDPAVRVELDLSVAHTSPSCNRVTIRVRRIMSGSLSLSDKLPDNCLQRFDLSNRSPLTPVSGTPFISTTIETDLDDDTLKEGVLLDVTVAVSSTDFY